LRALVAVIAAYIFFSRGECNALCLAEHLVVTTDHIILRLREENGKMGLRPGLRYTRKIA
jgi:hypothetical protein